jgi:hypothetical protein
MYRRGNHQVIVYPGDAKVWGGEVCHTRRLVGVFSLNLCFGSVSEPDVA